MQAVRASGGDGRQAVSRASLETDGPAVLSHPIRGPPRSTPMFVQLLKPFLNRQPGERIDVADSDARSLIEQQLAVPVTGDLITPAVSKALENAFSKFTQSLDSVINHTLQQYADAQSQSRKLAV